MNWLEVVGITIATVVSYDAVRIGLVTWWVIAYTRMDATHEAPAAE